MGRQTGRQTERQTERRMGRHLGRKMDLLMEHPMERHLGWQKEQHWVQHFWLDSQMVYYLGRNFR
jgi:hypothetical protein